MRTDEICEKHSRKAAKLTVKLLEDDAGFGSVLIQGGTEALRMLAELIVAVAEERENDGFEISPHGGGKIFFSKESTHGVYIHRLDNESASRS